MPPRIFQVSEYKEPIKQLLRDGLSVEDCAKQYPVSERTVWRYYKEVQDEKAGIVPEKKAATGVKPVKGTTEMAAITAKTPAPIIFRIGDQSIDLNPLDLLDAWRFCQDIKNMDPSIDDDFSSMLKVSTKHVWEHFSQREARRVGVTIEQESEEAEK